MNHQARATGNLEQRIHDAETGPVCRRRRGRRGVLPRTRADRPAGTSALAWTRPGGCPAPRRSESAAIWAPLFTKLVISGCSPWTFPARLVRPDRLPARAGARARPPVDRGHPGRTRARRGAGDRPLAWRHVRPVARSRRFRADLRWSRSESPPSRSRAYACACRCRC
jgi:hypothetical protein